MKRDSWEGKNMKQEQKYQIITTVFGSEVRLQTLYTFDEAVEYCMEATESFKRIGKEKNFSFTLAA